MPATRVTAFATVLLMAALALAGNDAPAPEGIRVDLPSNWPPALCGGRLFLFSSDGRNQTMGPADTAPECNLVQIKPTLPAVCGKDGVYVVDRDGVLWRLGDGPAATVAEGLKGAVAILPAPGGVAVVLPGTLRLPTGVTIPLPLPASGATALADGGFWIWGHEGAGRLSADGTLLWRWKPAAGEAGPAVLAGDRLYAGTGGGDLAALDAGSGRLRFSYRGGGSVVSPPVAWKNLVVYASRDHFVRAVDGRTGQLAWQVRMEGRPDFGPFPCGAGLLVAESAGSRLVVLSPENGRRVWMWRLPQGSLLNAPAVTARSAVVLAWDEAPTPVLYRVQLPEAKPPEAAPPKASPPEAAP